VLELVRGSLADILEVGPDSIAEGASFTDLGADSLALIELVEALEKDLGDGLPVSGSTTKTRGSKDGARRRRLRVSKIGTSS